MQATRSIFGADDRKIKESYDVPAIDLGSFLGEHTTPDDFVLMKMDIEGAEFAVVPSLISSGAACLIDEMYLECHSGGDIAKGRSYDDCITMLVALRGMGLRLICGFKLFLCIKNFAIGHYGGFTGCSFPPVCILRPSRQARDFAPRTPHRAAHTPPRGGSPVAGGGTGF